jgi:hypothetical protein
VAVDEPTVPAFHEPTVPPFHDLRAEMRLNQEALSRRLHGEVRIHEPGSVGGVPVMESKSVEKSGQRRSYALRRRVSGHLTCDCASDRNEVSQHLGLDIERRRDCVGLLFLGSQPRQLGSDSGVVLVKLPLELRPFLSRERAAQVVSADAGATLLDLDGLPLRVGAQGS